MKRLYLWMLAAILIISGTSVFTSCSKNDDNPVPQTNVPAQLKQGIWTEYDTVLVASGKYTMEELAEMPGVGMSHEGQDTSCLSQSVLTPS